MYIQVLNFFETNNAILENTIAEFSFSFLYFIMWKFSKISLVFNKYVHFSFPLKVQWNQLCRIALHLLGK